MSCQPSSSLTSIDSNYQGYEEEEPKLSPLGVTLGPIGPPSRYVRSEL